jgi:hypothetical protein
MGEDDGRCGPMQAVAVCEGNPETMTGVWKKSGRPLIQ